MFIWCSLIDDWLIEMKKRCSDSERWHLRAWLLAENNDNNNNIKNSIHDNDDIENNDDDINNDNNDNDDIKNNDNNNDDIKNNNSSDTIVF